MNRILFTHPSADLYGSDRTLLDLVKAIGRDAKEEFHATVALPRRGELADELERAGADVITCELGAATRADLSPGRLPGFLLRARRAAREVETLVEREGFDVVHTNTSVLVGAAQGAWRSGALHVWHVHEILDEPTWCNHAMRRMIHRWSDVAIAPSRATAASMFDPSLTNARIVPNGVDPSRLACLNPIGTRHQHADGGPLIVLPGRINGWKGQTLFVEAARMLHERGACKDATFLIVGDHATGGERHSDELDAAIAALDPSIKVKRLPFTKDLPSILAGADLCVVPSTRPEPFGLVAIEAMAVGTPVVAADHGGLREIVEDGSTGLRFRPGDAADLARAIETIMSDAQRRARMGAAAKARQRVRFTFERYAQGILSVYREALEGAEVRPLVAA